MPASGIGFGSWKGRHHVASALLCCHCFRHNSPFQHNTVRCSLRRLCLFVSFAAAEPYTKVWQLQVHSTLPQQLRRRLADRASLLRRYKRLKNQFTGILTGKG